MQIFLATGLMVWILCLNHLLGWESLLLFGRHGYAEMIKFLIINVVLFCRSSTVAQLCSVCGRVYNMWFIETSLRGCLHGWRIRRGIFFLNIGGSVICGLARLPHSSAFSHLLRCCLDFYFCSVCNKWIYTAACILAMQRPGVILFE
jgi:hypothetical protein